MGAQVLYLEDCFAYIEIRFFDSHSQTRQKIQFFILVIGLESETTPNEFLQSKQRFNFKHNKRLQLTSKQTVITDFTI